MEKFSEFVKCYCPHCGNKVEIKVERNGKYGGIIGGAISGAILGSNIGIAAGPLGAIAGTIPGLIIGAILGENVGAKFDDPICNKCLQSFKMPNLSNKHYEDISKHNTKNLRSKNQNSSQEIDKKINSANTVKLNEQTSVEEQMAKLEHEHDAVCAKAKETAERILKILKERKEGRK